MHFMSIRQLVPLIVAVLLFAGCNGTNITDGVLPGGDTSAGDAVTDQGPQPVAGSGAGTAGTTPGSATAGPVAVSGRIQPAQAAKVRPRMSDETYPYTVVIQSAQTGRIYRGVTNADGEFEIDVPLDEVGNTFVVTILGPDGQAIGPVLVAQAGPDGVTGLNLRQSADLGTITLPDDPARQPIEPGADSDVADLVDPNVAARLNADGAPVGVATHGKGQEAQTGTSDPTAQADADHDGLIDIFDADDNGDGTVDDLDPQSEPGETPPDAHANFFMNLKINPEHAQAYYAGTPEQVAERLRLDTIITLETFTDPGAARNIRSVRMLETPGPAYLPGADYMMPGNESMAFTNWKAAGYAFFSVGRTGSGSGARWSVFVRPNEVMQAGDVFTAEITFDDGDTVQYSRMINYVFKNIPRLVRYGSPGALSDFNVTDAAINGMSDHPIPFDGTQDLVLVFNPPKDETGAYITGMGYQFEIFYDVPPLGQVNSQIDVAATWPTPIPHFDAPRAYEVQANALGALSAESTYTVTLPKTIFADAVYLTGGGTAAVSSYKIDIAAQCPSGNAAIMLGYKKR